MDNNLITVTDEMWMEKALDSAQRALGKHEFPVGCILVSGDRIIGRGDRINSRGVLENELDHAEIRAIRDLAQKGHVTGGFTAYTTLEPCLMCLGALILNGAERIVYAYEDVMGGATGIDFDQRFSRSSHTGDKGKLLHLYRGFSDRIRGGVLRRESLRLFRDFFSRPENTYLKGTLLEKYTLFQANNSPGPRDLEP